jgi:leucyl-tRNA synthetase
MPNWAGSSWYFLAYLANKEFFKSPASLATWNSQLATFSHFMPVDWYNGGMEHVTLHLLYSRFWNQFLFDQKLVPASEPYKKRTAHGMILATDGKKMSKSLGNVVNPDDLVKEFGADAVRLYILFIAPFSQSASWDNRGVLGTARFLEKVWRTGVAVANSEALPAGRQESSPEIQRLLHRTIKKVGEDIESMSFNTAVSAMMIFINELSAPSVIASEAKQSSISLSDWQKFLIMLSPFAPHIAEELYSLLTTNYSLLLCEQPWPEYDPALLVDANFDLIVQVNSKVRGKIKMARGSTESQALTQIKADAEIAKWLTGEIKKVVFIADRLINIII